jgi:putative peptidoglycan lipid II flippase
VSRRVGIAALIWGSSVLLSRVIGLFREAAMGRILGGGAQADLYFLAFNLPDWLNYLLAGGALSLVFIPIFAGHLARGDEAGGWRAFSTIANTLCLVLAVVLPVAWLLTPRLTPLYAPGLGPDDHALLVRLTRIVLPAQAFHIVGGLLSAALQARDRHALPALAGLAYNGAIVLGGLLGGTEWGAEGFAWGVLVGSAIGPFGLPLYGCLREGLGWRPTLELRHPDLRTWAWRSLPVMLAFSVVAADDWVQRGLGTTLGAGAVATVQYGKQLMKVPMGVFGFAMGAASFPTISRLVGEGQRAEAFAVLSRAVRQTVVLALLAQVVLTVAGEEVAQVIYGGRIGAEQYEALGVALSLTCLGLWAWSAQTVVARGFYADGNTWLPSLLGTGVLVAMFPAYLLGARALGTAGLALASSATISLYVLLLIRALRRRYPGCPDGYGPFALRVVPATGLGIGAGLLVERAAALPSPLLQGALVGGVGALVYLGAVLLFGVDEARALLRMVRRRLPRGRA